MMNHITSLVRNNLHKCFFVTAGITETYLLYNHVCSVIYNSTIGKVHEVIENHRKQNNLENELAYATKSWESIVKFLLVTFGKGIDEKYNSEKIITELKNHPKDKHALWNQLKVTTWCQMLCSIIGHSLLVVFTCIKVHMIAGYMHLDINLSEAHLQCLEAFEYFMSGGFCNFCDNIEEAVLTHIGDMQLSQSLKADDLVSTFRMIINSTQIQNILRKPSKYFIIGRDNFSDAISKASYFETKEIFDSVDTQIVINDVIRTSLVTIDKDLMCAYEKRIPKDHGSPDAATLPLAKILPILSQIHVSNMSKGDYIFTLINSNKAKCLAENIFESYSCFVTQIPADTRLNFD